MLDVILLRNALSLWYKNKRKLNKQTKPTNKPNEKNPPQQADNQVTTLKSIQVCISLTSASEIWHCKTRKRKDDTERKVNQKTVKEGVLNLIDRQVFLCSSFFQNFY